MREKMKSLGIGFKEDKMKVYYFFLFTLNDLLIFALCNNIVKSNM